MCVLTYLPLANGGFVLTHNRDESTARAKAISPRQYWHNGQSVVYPKDPQAGGTWIASSVHFTLCLLNGAFEKHESNLPYRQSRGWIILDFFKYSSISNFIENYQFTGIEPFTLIITTNAIRTLTVVRWNGQEVFVSSKDDSKPYIWSSATLYSATIRHNREMWFENWVEQNLHFEAEKILKFHHTGGNGDVENDLKMNRNGELLTQCIVQIKHKNSLIHEIIYQDLLTNNEQIYRIL